MKIKGNFEKLEKLSNYKMKNLREKPNRMKITKSLQQTSESMKWKSELPWNVKSVVKTHWKDKGTRHSVVDTSSMQFAYENTWKLRSDKIEELRFPV